MLQGVMRVKMWGKSPRSVLVTMQKGKPCVLKCHVKDRLRAARPMIQGRQIHPGLVITGADK